jgi:hypothetical protein
MRRLSQRRGAAAWLTGMCALLSLAATASPSLAATEVGVDCGDGADLQAAIDAAPKGAILEIAGTCVGSFTVGKKLTLRGASDAVLDAQGAPTTLTVTAGTVRFSHLTVTGAGDAVGDGDEAIANAGSLTLVKTSVMGNNVLGILNSGTLLVQRSVITENGVDDQGGIANRGTATVESSTISDNHGTGIASSQQLTVIDSTVSGNVDATDAGGIEVSGTTTIIRSTVANNVDFNGEGGGIINGGLLTITQSTIVGNRGDDLSGGLENLGTASVSGTIVAGKLPGIASARSDRTGTT